MSFENAVPWFVYENGVYANTHDWWLQFPPYENHSESGTLHHGNTDYPGDTDTWTYSPQVSASSLRSLEDYTTLEIDHIGLTKKVALMECSDGPILLDDPEVTIEEANLRGLEVRGEYAYLM
jgi:hypothetical protein